MLEAPHVAARSCEDCQKWMYDDDGQSMGSKRIDRGNGDPVERPRGSKTPCWKCPKIPKGKRPCPENAVEMNDRSRAALWYYRQCRADSAGILVRDRLTIANNALIQTVMDSHERATADETNMLLRCLLGIRT